MGPALALKVAADRRFSVLIFGFSQFVTDLEPLIGLFRGSAVLHGFTHTFVGATLIGILSVVVGRPVCEWMLGIWNERPSRIPSTAVYSGAFVGTYSHVFLDGMMHLDMRPFAPFSDANPMLGALSWTAIYVVCTATGVLGWAALACRSGRR